MWDNILRYLYVFTIFILGLASSVIIYGLHFAYTFVFISKDEAMKEWYAWWRSKKDAILEQKRKKETKDMITQAVKDALKPKEEE